MDDCQQKLSLAWWTAGEQDLHENIREYCEVASGNCRLAVLSADLARAAVTLLLRPEQRSRPACLTFVKHDKPQVVSEALQCFSNERSGSCKPPSRLERPARNHRRCSEVSVAMLPFWCLLSSWPPPAEGRQQRPSQRLFMPNRFTEAGSLSHNVIKRRLPRFGGSTRTSRKFVPVPPQREDFVYLGPHKRSKQLGMP